MTSESKSPSAVRAQDGGEMAYHRLFETSRDGMALLDGDTGAILDANPFLLGLLGCTLEAVQGRPIWEIGAFRDTIGTDAAFAALRAREYVRRDDLQLRLGDGRCIPVEFVSHVYPVDQRCVVQCSVRDITERKRAEAAQALQRVEHEAQRQCAEAQLRQAKQLEAVGRLAGGVAHDFNNTLQTILGFAEILLSDSSLAGRHRQDVLEIHKSGRHAADLTRQLLAFGRRQMMEPKTVDLNALVAGSERVLQRVIGEDIRVFSRLAPELRRVRADAGQIEQILMKLAVHARDAMPHGGRLTLATRNVTLNEQDATLFPDARPGDFVCLAVADTGAGLAPEELEHVFEPFYGTEGRGGGLGLPAIYGIARQHEGWIHASSHPGQGTSFSLYLPACAERAAAVESALHEGGPPRGKGQRILLVEDEPDVRRLAARILETAGYTVLSAEAVQSALSLFERESGRFDLLFSDVMMPDGNGLELADRLLAQRPGLPVLLASGYADEHLGHGTIREKGFPLLQKPYPGADLLLAVHRLIDPRPVPA